MAGYLEYKPPADDNPTVLELSKIEDLSIEPVMTLDDLNVSHVRHVMRIRCLFTAVNAATFYQELRDITKVLTTPRGRLIIATDSTKTDILHDIDPNATSGTGLRPDIEGGPKPRSLDVQEFITGIAAHIVWTVEYNILPCDTNADDLPNVLSRHHSVDFSYSDEGRLLRTIAGELRIPDRIKSAAYEKNVQNAQGAAYFHVPRGWRRISASLGISPNGLVLQFQFVDEELELGWHDLAQSMDLEWTERSTILPPSIEFTFTFRVKGRRGIPKTDLIKEIVIPMANDRFRQQSASMPLPGSAEWKEDLLTNEVSGSIKLVGRKFKTSASGNLTSARYLPPSKAFGTSSKRLRRVNPNQIAINGKNTNFDSVLLADDGHRKRWETLPLLTRFIVKDLCDRSRVDPSADYDEEDESESEVLIELLKELDRPEPEAPVGGEGGRDKRSPILLNEPYATGNYLVDEEVMQIIIDYHTEVIGNRFVYVDNLSLYVFGPR